MTVAEIMEAVKELKVMELSELVKALEEEFGVSATPVAVAGAASRLATAQLLLTLRPTSTSFWLTLAPPRSTLSRLSARSPAWA